MERDEKNIPDNEGLEKSFAFLSSLRKGQEITVRDDLFDFQLLLDAVKLSRRKGIPFRIVDSGSLDVLRIEWLAAEGAAVYTSDDAGRELEVLARISKACRRGGTFLAYLHNAPLNQETDSVAFDLPGLMHLGAEGTYIFMSNRDRKRDLSQLCALADHCSRGGSWLVYYHHGELEASLPGLAGYGTWIHIGDDSLKEPGDFGLLLDVIGSARAVGVNCVLHLEREREFYALKDIQREGAVLIFKSPLIDYRSHLKPIQVETSRHKLDSRAYYLYSTFLF